LWRERFFYPPYFYHRIFEGKLKRWSYCENDDDLQINSSSDEKRKERKKEMMSFSFFILELNIDSVRPMHKKCGGLFAFGGEKRDRYK
jgi:hypothetical protein